MDLHDSPEEQLVATKICTRCEVEKSIYDFGKDSGANYRKSKCKQCASEISRALYRIKKSKGDPDAEQLCEVCNQPSEKTLCLDHDHDSETFRGWLCHHCNLGIGMFKNDPGVMQQAVDYLMRTMEKK